MMAQKRLSALYSHLNSNGGCETATVPGGVGAPQPDAALPRAVGASGAPPRAVVEAARKNKFSDAQMKQFLSQGYMIIPVTDLEKDFHEGIYQKAKTLYRAEEGGGVDFGNNVFPAVPDIGKIYQAPSVVGALTSVLGDDYVMYAPPPPSPRAHTSTPAPHPPPPRPAVLV